MNYLSKLLIIDLSLFIFAKMIFNKIAVKIKRYHIVNLSMRYDLLEVILKLKSNIKQYAKKIKLLH